MNVVVQHNKKKSLVNLENKFCNFSTNMLWFEVTWSILLFGLHRRLYRFYELPYSESRFRTIFLTVNKTPFLSFYYLRCFYCSCPCLYHLIDLDLYVDISRYSIFLFIILEAIIIIIQIKTQKIDRYQCNFIKFQKKKFNLSITHLREKLQFSMEKKKDS